MNSEPSDLMAVLSSGAVRGVLGLGRVCVDRYITIEATGHRLNATKSTFTDDALAIGGSVPRILATCRSLGNDTFLMTGAADDDVLPWLTEGLAALVDGVWFGSLPRTPDSLIVHDADGRLIEILSGREARPLRDEEVHGEGLATLVARGEGRDGLAPPGVIVADGRHPEALAVLKAAFPTSHIEVDPGSSAVDVPGETFDGLLELADLIYLSEDQARSLAGTADFRDAVVRRAAEEATSVIVTLGPEGAFITHAGEVATAPSWPVKPRFSSIGAGDTFKGVVASALLQQPGLATRSLDIADLTSAVRLGLMGAAWRLDSSSILPGHPSVVELAAFREASLRGDS